jgi:hypothetical protein
MKTAPQIKASDKEQLSQFVGYYVAGLSAAALSSLLYLLYPLTGSRYMVFFVIAAVVVQLPVIYKLVKKSERIEEAVTAMAAEDMEAYVCEFAKIEVGLVRFTWVCCIVMTALDLYPFFAQSEQYVVWFGPDSRYTGGNVGITICSVSLPLAWLIFAFYMTIIGGAFEEILAASKPKKRNF